MLRGNMIKIYPTKRYQSPEQVKNNNHISDLVRALSEKMLR